MQLLPEIAIAVRLPSMLLRSPGFQSVGFRVGNLPDGCGWLQFRPRLLQPAPPHRAASPHPVADSRFIEQVELLPTWGEKLSTLGWIAIAAALKGPHDCTTGHTAGTGHKNNRLGGSVATS